ncbi:hypothetical protein JVU11DRAFT_8768 [Chiua virens]|nr:hypothetical protein JVU11DRAFT_8768 [Chiua virens]
MVILDEKYMIPPPPYVAADQVAPPPFPSSSSHRHSLATLPAHLLLKIVYMTFLQTPWRGETRLQRQRKTLYWLSHQLRLVNRSLYIGQSSITVEGLQSNLIYPSASMHVLRSTFFPLYASLIRAPYTSDPFPLSSSSASPTGPLETVQRETHVLDLFIALKVREDVMMDDTEFHLEREESFKDLFDLMQPRSRLEDLVRSYGVRENVVHTNKPSASSSASGSQSHSGSAKLSTGPTSLPSLPFSMLSIAFSPRKVGLVLNTTTRKRTILEVARTRDEELEVTAMRIIKQLKVWLSDA